MPWQFELTADDEADITKLAVVFPSGDPFVSRRDNRYELVTKSVDASSSPSDALSDARRLLGLMTGFVRTADDAQGRCKLTGRMLDPSGRRHAVVELGPAGRRARVFGGTLVRKGASPPPPPGPRVMAAATTDAAVADLLELMSCDRLDWSDLYKVYEIVKHELGRNGILAWATNDELRRFTATANHPEVSGPTGRHARTRNAPPSQPMELSEATKLLRRVASQFVIQRIDGTETR